MTQEALDQLVQDRYREAIKGLKHNQGGIMELTPEQIAAENEAWASHIEWCKKDFGVTQ